jgi:glucose-6-phosphate dehydrogenase assembly protein OpcA
LDLPPNERVTDVVVTGEADSPSTELLAAWLAVSLKASVQRKKATQGEGIVSVRLERRSGALTLERPDGKVGTLEQPGQPARRVALQRRSVQDCLTEELRRLDPDEIYEMTLKGLDKLNKARSAANGAKTASAARRAPRKAPARKSKAAAAKGSS